VKKRANVKVKISLGLTKSPWYSLDRRLAEPRRERERSGLNFRKLYKHISVPMITFLRWKLRTEIVAPKYLGENFFPT
jgi:hypothetical protein